jgi:hypothetical protein
MIALPPCKEAIGDTSDGVTGGEGRTRLNGQYAGLFLTRSRVISGHARRWRADFRGSQSVALRRRPQAWLVDDSGCARVARQCVDFDRAGLTVTGPSGTVTDPANYPASGEYRAGYGKWFPDPHAESRQRPDGCPVRPSPRSAHGLPGQCP